MAELEYAEWCDYWWENAPDQKMPRVLLIGDSITRAYRPYVNEYLNHKYLVDMVASSRALDNPVFLKEVFYILKNSGYHYEILHFNSGLHGQHLTATEFKDCFYKTLDTIRENTDAKIILGSCTPVYNNGYSNPYNFLVQERNRSISAYAYEHNILLHDLYRISYNRPEFRLPDGLHYNEQGSRVQARQVADMILSC